MRHAPLYVLLISLTGCSIKTPFINASQWPGEKRVPYYNSPTPFRIGVLPLTDQRPDQERQGQRPHGMFLLLWNRRVGEYYTGDHIFGGQLPARLTDQLVNSLQGTNTFAEVVALKPPTEFDVNNAKQVSDLGKQEAVDYVLQGDLEHFFGSQSQHTSIVLLPLYFITTFSWQDSKSLPWGKTAITYRFYDGRTGDMIWRRLVEADRTLPTDKDAMSEAAMESFAQGVGQLAAQLRELPLSTMASSQ